MEMMDLTLAQFARSLAEAEPTPGGGAAAAYVGALGAALAGMALGYSTGEGAGEGDRPSRIAEEIARMAELRESLLRLSAEDGEAYGAYAAARGLSRNDPEARRRRKTALRTALDRALEVPRRAADLSLQGLDRLATVSPLVSPRLTADLGVSARCFHAAFHSCWYNVEVNARTLKDEERAEALRRERREKARRLEKSLAEVLRRVEKT